MKKIFTYNFTLLIMGQTFSLFGNFTLKFALSMYILDQTQSASIFASMLALAMVPTILLSPFGGILADRKNRRNIMVCLDVISCITVFTCTILLSFCDDIAVIGVLVVALSVLGAFESPTVQACVPQMLSGESILKGNAVVNQIAAIASLVTPFLGSLVYSAFGIQPVLYGTAICFLITAMLEWFIRLDFQKPTKKERILDIVKGDFSMSIRFLYNEQPNILKLLLLAALVSFFIAGCAVVGFPYLVRTVLGLSANHYGIAESAMGIAAILGGFSVSLLGKKLKIDKLYMMMLILGLCLLPIGGILLCPYSTLVKYIILVLAFCVCQIACSIFSIYSLTVIQERTPQHLTGKVMAFIVTISMCAQPLGQIIFGFLFDKFSRSTYLVLIPCGIVVSIISLLSIGFFKKMSNEENEKITEETLG